MNLQNPLLPSFILDNVDITFLAYTDLLPYGSYAGRLSPAECPECEVVQSSVRQSVSVICGLIELLYLIQKRCKCD